MKNTQNSTKTTTRPAQKPERFTDEERAAVKERARELRRVPQAGQADGESDVLAKIAEMTEPDRVLAERLHALVKAVAPDLAPRTWYGMPAYAKNDKVICFFQSAQKFKTRYAMLGFSDQAHLDQDTIWPVTYALTTLADDDSEARVGALLKKAVS